MSANNSRLKENLYMQKYNAWKEKKKQAPGSVYGCPSKGIKKSLDMPAKNLHHPASSSALKRSGNGTGKRATGASFRPTTTEATNRRRRTFEVPEALRNSPIHLLPHITGDVGESRQSRASPKFRNKLSHTTLFRQNQTHNEAAKINNLKPQSKLQVQSTNMSKEALPNQRRASPATKRSPLKPQAWMVNVPKSAPTQKPSVPFSNNLIQQRRLTSACQQAAVQPTKPRKSLAVTVPYGATGDYMERFKKWKEQKQKVSNKTETRGGSQKARDRKPFSICQPIGGQSAISGVNKSAESTNEVSSKHVDSHKGRRRTLANVIREEVIMSKPEPSRRRRTMAGTSNCADQSSAVSTKRNTTQPCRKRGLSQTFDVTEVKKPRRSFDITTSLPPRRSNQPTVCKTQQSLRHQLDDWLKAKGKTPSRFRHMMCYDAHRSAGQKRDQSLTKPMLSVDDLSQQQKAMELESVQANLLEQFDQAAEEEEVKRRDMERKLDTILEECMTLFEVGCPVTSLLPWLDSIQENIPGSVESAKFWICKARVVKATKNTNQVLEVFEQAVRHSAKPADALAKTLTEMVREMTEIKADKHKDKIEETACHTPRKNKVQLDNIFHSSAIKFCVKDRTPLLKRLRETCGREGSSPCVVTPVRRSTRRSLATIHESLQEKEQLYDSFSDIPTEEKESSLYQHNLALEDVLSLHDLKLHQSPAMLS